ncbi:MULTISPECIES: CPBP family intramembrane glutamic endopeptidase [Vagococcus]|uniref:Putative metal-dependent membrane protease n=1 Tax=Vagococcus fluvialis bH819 TaxID=1255619 RepID=A0A1X6WMI3_9ENTE|nr:MULTISPECIES: CPBP family intramembrane glutamic endopeptidase [Vagococcus]SLM85475.1 putative metal-dependent membrane protease [Vagococcus fluvialis bH819]HCM89230.1 CPBP family intramembrane metalloprotease [Vagococcus sp.]
MIREKKLNSLAMYVILFFVIWTIYELLVKPYISLKLSPITGTLIQTVIKLSVWSLPSYLLIKKNKNLPIPFPEIYNTKIDWKKWTTLALGMILYLLIGSYFQYGNLEIRNSFKLITVINSVLFVGITEELVFRGLILNTLLIKFNKWLVIVVSSVLFLMIHFPVWIQTNTFSANLSSGGFVQVFILGIIFSLSFIKSRNIFVPIMLHMVWNLFTILFY